MPQVTLLAHELKQAGLDLPDGILSVKELTEALERYRKEMRSEKTDVD